MVGGGVGRVKAALLLALLAGCFWRSYAGIVATHVDVLTAMARKGTDLVAAGRLTAESLPELTYPLERAQAFARSAESKSAGHRPPSLDAFRRLLERYREFLDALDRTRRETSGEAARAALAPRLDALAAAAADVKQMLADEART
jgi:hypothetical protein